MVVGGASIVRRVPARAGRLYVVRSQGTPADPRRARFAVRTIIYVPLHT